MERPKSKSLCEARGNVLKSGMMKANLDLGVMKKADNTTFMEEHLDISLYYYIE